MVCMEINRLCSSKQIMFMLRDFNEKEDSLEHIKDMMLSDMNKLWEEITKPPELANSTPAEFFHFQFKFMPHFHYNKTEFMGEVENLKESLEPNSTDNIFKSEGRQEIPIDGLPAFIEQTWVAIQSEKDLHLPSQREMVAAFRCNEFKEFALTHVREKIIRLTKAVEKNNCYDFANQSKRIVEECLRYYHEEAKFYMDKVVADVERSLKQTMFDALYIPFQTEAKKQVLEFDRQFKRKSKSLSKKGIRHIYIYRECEFQLGGENKCI